MMIKIEFDVEDTFHKMPDGLSLLTLGNISIYSDNITISTKTDNQLCMIFGSMIELVNMTCIVIAKSQKISSEFYAIDCCFGFSVRRKSDVIEIISSDRHTINVSFTGFLEALYDGVEDFLLKYLDQCDPKNKELSDMRKSCIRLSELLPHRNNLEKSFILFDLHMNKDKDR